MTATDFETVAPVSSSVCRSRGTCNIVTLGKIMRVTLLYLCLCTLTLTTQRLIWVPGTRDYLNKKKNPKTLAS